MTDTISGKANEDLVPRIKVGANTAEGERIMQIMSVMLGSAAFDQKSDDLDPAQHTAFTMAAAGFLAGYLTGASIIAGTLCDRDKRRCGEMLLTNFRQGIQIGKQAAMDKAGQLFGEGHA